MSVYFAAQWSVRPAEVEVCEAAMQTISEHIQASHPGVLSVQVYRQLWGPFPRRAYLWLEEYASLTAMENEPETSACSQVWKPIEEMALEGTYLCSVWSNPNPTVWFKR